MRLLQCADFQSRRLTAPKAEGAPARAGARRRARFARVKKIAIAPDHRSRFASVNEAPVHRQTTVKESTECES